MLHTSLASLSSAKTLPYLVMFLTSNLGGWAGDYLIAQRITTTAGGRKAVNTIGIPLAPLGLCAQPLSVVLLELGSIRNIGEYKY